ncbi:MULTISPECIES: 5-formyltetrahydrofolate cyclo-ligase [unclassified Nitratiruptor]|uniref:5-formyltetrahydrofolate cyclo-ligase n=1 Tax=unclassified Nitratiruptor TaxID=2624044 RepID=UPI0019167F20|nr:MULTISPECIES: 5-formyltetrahydrofolate cyclo-ligase [unclassified Nitratiruptor]
MRYDKPLFRQICKEKIFKVKAKRKKEEKVQKIVLKLISLTGAKNILAYVPMPHEPQMKKIFALRDKKKIFVPFMQAKSFKMVKLRLPLKKKKFSIFEPGNSHLEQKIDMAIIPVIGVDGDFRRVGFGKGMYDRFFARLSYRPIVVFVQIKKCFTNTILTDTYDVLGDILVTPEEILIRGDSDVGRAVSRKLCSNNKWRCRVYRRKKVRKREV